MMTHLGTLPGGIEIEYYEDSLGGRLYFVGSEGTIMSLSRKDTIQLARMLHYKFDVDVIDE